MRNKYRVYKAIKRPTLSQQHKIDRLNLAAKYSKSDCDFVFSDEKKFTLKDNNSVELVTRPKGSNAYESQYMKYGKQVSSNADVNIWAYIGPFGKGAF